MDQRVVFRTLSAPEREGNDIQAQLVVHVPCMFNRDKSLFIVLLVLAHAVVCSFFS